MTGAIPPVGVGVVSARVDVEGVTLTIGRIPALDAVLEHGASASFDLGVLLNYPLGGSLEFGFRGAAGTELVLPIQRIFGTGEFVGLCGLLTQEVDGKMELEIGYHLLPGQWHKGFATEAAVFCKAFAREKALAPSVISLIDPDNLPSQRVAERNGLQLERTTLFRGKPARVYRGLIGSVD